MRSSNNYYYHFLPAKYALCDIENRRLKVATFDDVNDPFELLGVNLGSENSREKNRETRIALRRWRDRVTKKYGVLCFSDGWSNPLLWSHYGDKHRGIGLGFSVAELQEVNYKQERVPLETWNPAVDIQSILWTKFEHWKYEAEHRRFVLLKDCRLVIKCGRCHYYWPFGSDLQLRRVVIGAKCAIDIKELEQALGKMQASVEIIRARVAFQHFAVVSQKDLQVAVRRRPR